MNSVILLYARLTVIHIITMNSNILKILQICDSLFPIGSFTLSNGLETYVQNNIISSANQLKEYLDSYISIMCYNELGTVVLAYKNADIQRIDAVYNAVKTPKEIRMGSVRTARQFFRIIEKTNSEIPCLKEYIELVKNEKSFGHLPIAYGLYMRDCGADLSEGLNIYGYSICSAIVTNCVKLVPLSQLDGQRILNELLPKISEACEKAVSVSIEEIGIGGCGFDIRAMQHEKLYSRQYMS